MREYFVITNSNAAPFFSDTDKMFMKAKSPEECVKKVRKNYKHPAGLYAMAVFADANAYYKGEKPLVCWLSKRADIRQNGVKCPRCGGRTELIAENMGEKGTDDIHLCKNCGTEVTVDMTTFEVRESAVFS